MCLSNSFLFALFKIYQPNIFDEIDANDDNVITKEELVSWFKNKRQMDELPAGIWESEDKDKDGQITWEEFSGTLINE